MGSRLSISPARYRHITLVALFLLAFIIVTGAAVRLTGSGLGCSDWPTCEEDQFVAEFDDLHAMVEFVNRVITGLVSLAVIAAVLGSMWRTPRRRDLTMWSWGLVAGVVAQIILGALVVREHLPPELVMGHFLVSMVLVWNAMVLYHRAGLPDDEVDTRDVGALRWHIRSLSLLAGAVLVTGTFVTGAGPHSGADSREIEDALEAQGVDLDGLDTSEITVDRLPFDVSDVAQVHGVTVMTFLAVSVWLALRLRRGPSDLFRSVQTLIFVLVTQAAIGYVQYFSDVPALLVGVHVAGSIAVWCAVLDLHLRSRHPRPEPVTELAPATPTPATNPV